MKICGKCRKYDVCGKPYSSLSNYAETCKEFESWKMTKQITSQEAIRRLNVFSSTNGSGQCTTEEHEEAKRFAIQAIKEFEQEKKINENLINQLKTAQKTIHQLREGVRIGKWISHEDELGVTFECSVCHMETCSEAPFCPNCGAEMGKSNKILEIYKSIKRS